MELDAVDGQQCPTCLTVLSVWEKVTCCHLSHIDTNTAISKRQQLIFSQSAKKTTCKSTTQKQPTPNTQSKQPAFIAQYVGILT